MQIIISKLNLLGPAIIFSRIISWISGILGGLFSTISAILIIILAFQVREVIDNVYNQKNSSGIGTFFFNILYLQVRINNPNRKSLTNLQKNTRNDYKSLFLFALLFSALILLYSLPTNNAKLSIEEAASLEEGNFEAAYKVTILFDVPDKFLNNETGIIAGGEVLSGTLRKGMKTTINEKESRVNFIEIGHEYADSVNKGDEAAVGLTNLVSKDELKVGSIIYFNTS